MYFLSHICCVFVYFGVKDAAHTAIYPYCHPLSLNDARPIWIGATAWTAAMSGRSPQRPGSVARRRCVRGNLSDRFPPASTKEIGNVRRHVQTYRRRLFGTHPDVRDQRGDYRRSRRTERRRERTRLPGRSEEHTSELQSLMRISYAVFCLKKKTTYVQLIQPTR